MKAINGATLYYTVAGASEKPMTQLEEPTFDSEQLKPGQKVVFYCGDFFMALIAVITRGEIFENYVIVIVLSMCIYVKNILEMIQKLYHWITTESEENHYDIVKMTFIWTIIAFIIRKDLVEK